MEAKTRAAKFADDFVAAQDELVRLVESIRPDQWRLVGKNFPDRSNNEDEGRSVGVIAHHVADSEQFIIDRIYQMLEGKTLTRVDFHDVNARHAANHADVTHEEVLALLRANRASIEPRVRAIPDDALDAVHDTPAGPATIAQRLDRVLIGHLKVHQGSIEAALSA